MTKSNWIIVLAAAFAGISAIGIRAQAPGGAAAPAGANLAGYWVVQDPGSGSWEEWWDNGPGVRAKVRPEFAKLNEEEMAFLRAGNVVNRAGRGQNPGCAPGNLAMSWASSGAQQVTVSPGEIKLGPQLVHTDGRPHVDTKSAAYNPTGNGDSIGHWERDTLLVDTIGFPSKICDTRFPVMRVTGGGRAKDTTHLTERVRLTDPDTLQIVFRWDDPTIYLEPYRYTYNFKRVPKPADDPPQAQPTRQFLTDKYWPRQ